VQIKDKGGSLGRIVSSCSRGLIEQTSQSRLSLQSDDHAIHFYRLNALS
ncbi:hypothetical protein LINPERHAP2_LOCUS26166, partial [Linum perenne]